MKLTQKSGSCIIQIFPAIYYLKIFRWKTNGVYNKIVYFILCLGIVTFFGNSSLVLYQQFKPVDEQHELLANQTRHALEMAGKSLLDISESSVE